MRRRILVSIYAEMIIHSRSLPAVKIVLIPNRTQIVTDYNCDNFRSRMKPCPAGFHSQIRRINQLIRVVTAYLAQNEFLSLSVLRIQLE